MDTPEDILDASQFSYYGDFDEQVSEILTTVRLTRAEVQNLQQLLNDVKHSLSHVWPGCQVHPFGSIITGLGIKTSDIDCFVQLPIHCKNSGRYQDSNPVVAAKQVLRKNSKTFTQLFAITTAKVPIIKFMHIPTGFNCDVNFSSFNGVRNSKLIAYLLSLDSRALSLAILIKYWSRVYNLTGTNLMPNYALILMVIFYLQEKMILPSVSYLQRYTTFMMLDEWDTYFDDSEIHETDNDESLYLLLGDFFSYYANFDYKQLVISPFLGHPIKKEFLTDVQALPNQCHLYKVNLMQGQCRVLKVNTVVCIQDPFEHSRNCSVGVFERLFNKIYCHFNYAARFFKEKKRDEFLKTIFTMTIKLEPQIPEDTKPEFKTRNKIEKKKYYQNKARLKKETRMKIKKQLLNQSSQQFNRFNMVFNNTR